jgi:hypothetical protein
MATFIVKAPEQISALPADDGDIAYIENADQVGNSGVAFRSRARWTKPFISYPLRLTNTVTTDTPQVITGAKNFLGEVRFGTEKITFASSFFKVSKEEFSFIADETTSSKANIKASQFEVQATDGKIKIKNIDTIEGSTTITVDENSITLDTPGLGGRVDINGIGTNGGVTELSSAFSGGSQTIVRLAPDKVTMEAVKIYLPDLVVAANNAGAIGQGLTAGMLYRTTTGEVRVVV